MKRFLSVALSAAELLGAAAIVDGIWRVSVPAALVVAGLLVVVGAALAERSMQ
jgi:hypothetical protein